MRVSLSTFLGSLPGCRQLMFSNFQVFTVCIKLFFQLDNFEIPVIKTGPKFLLKRSLLLEFLPFAQ